MIFIAVGTQKFQFNRLLQSIDHLIEQKIITEEVVAQTGNCDYKPVNFSFTKFMNKEEFEKNISECHLLITHSGVGTIIAGLRRKKPVIVFPRKAEFGEHVDDHQFQIAEAFKKKNLVVMCTNEEELSDAICTSREMSFEKYISGRTQIIARIEEFISDVEN